MQNDQSKRIVVDTNVLVSAALWPRSLPDQAVQFVIQRKMLLLSAATFDELSEVVLRPKFERFLPHHERALYLADLYSGEFIELVEITQSIADCRDPKDDKFLEVAVNGNADCIISGDKDLLVLHPYRGIDVLTPRQFLEQHNRSE